MCFKPVAADSLKGIALAARDVCQKGPVSNLLLCGTLNVEDIFKDDMVLSHGDAAKEWQDSTPSKYLYFSHGYYMDRGGLPGRDFIVSELKAKRDSNRACVSLIAQNDLVGSMDHPIPAFMVLQCSFVGDGLSELQMTAYFRALEVHNFLPINLAEICSVLAHIRTEFPEIAKVHLAILAFRAYSNPRFDCLRKSEIDAVSADDVEEAVGKRKCADIIRWLDLKISKDHSVVCATGLENLRDCLVKHNDLYSPELIDHVARALEYTQRLKVLREKRSHSTEIDKLNQSIRSELETARVLLSKTITV